MGIILVACAALGFLCVCANLLDAVGKAVVALLKYVVSPIVIFLLILFAIYCINR